MRYGFFTIVALMAMTFMSSCSVKEDRSLCPCFVSVKIQTADPCDVGFFAMDGTLLASKTMYPEELCSGDNWTEIRRVGYFSVGVIRGRDDMRLDLQRKVFCLDGKQTEKVYSCSLSSYAGEDNVMVEGVLHKQHTNFVVNFTASNLESFFFRTVVESGSYGLDVISGKPVSGVHSFGREVDAEDMVTSFRVLRLGEEDGLHLKLYKLEDDSFYADIDLKKALDKVGYDWMSEDLKDVELTFDVSQRTLKIKVDNWAEVTLDLSLER